MRARSAICTHLQHPFTIFGLPPALLGASVGAAMALFVLCMALGMLISAIFTTLSMVVFVAAVIGFITASYRVTRDDAHFLSVLATARRFWRSASRRNLLAGSFLETCPGKERP